MLTDKKEINWLKSSQIRNYLRKRTESPELLTYNSNNLTVFVNSSELFYDLATKNARDLKRHHSSIEAVIDLETRKGIIPWKLVLDPEHINKFIEKYGKEVPLNLDNQFNPNRLCKNHTQEKAKRLS